jgi:hypothetical protein
MLMKQQTHKAGMSVMDSLLCSIKLKAIDKLKDSIQTLKNTISMGLIKCLDKVLLTPKKE